MPDEHHDKGPSSHKNIFQCPGFENKQDGPTHFVTSRGTRLHDALEHGTILDLESEEEQAICQQVEDFVQTQIAGVMGDLETDKFEEHREIRVELDLGKEVLFGTCDRAFLFEKQGFAWVCDYKFGYGKVDDAEENDQARAYSAGLFQMYPWLKKIEFHFIQPYTDDDSSAVFTRDKADIMRLIVSTIVERARRSDQRFPAPNLCEFCKHQGGCPALWDKVEELVGKHCEDKLPVPEGLETVEDVAKAKELVTILESQVRHINKRAFELAIVEGNDLPGFKTIEVAKPRKIKDVLETYDFLKDQIDLDVFLSMCGEVSVTKLETFVKANAPRGEKGSSMEKMEGELRRAGLMSAEDYSYQLRKIR